LNELPLSGSQQNSEFLPDIWLSFGLPKSFHSEPLGCDSAGHQYPDAPEVDFFAYDGAFLVLQITLAAK
jgi:hypothetical protein